MSANAVAHAYSYAHASALVREDSRQRLALATSGGVTEKLGEVADEHPHFFQGALVQPAITARCLTTLAKIVAARFTPTPQERQAMKDPVVTSGGGYLRFEGFSNCGGLYGRLDLTKHAYDGLVTDQGTTNVDFNAPMRQALARIRDQDAVSLSVGAEEVALTRNTEQTVEQKVKLPKRWLKGFTEVQAYLARMAPRYELPRNQSVRFLRSIPRSVPGATPMYVSTLASTLRFGSTPSKGAVVVRGIERLRLLDELIPLVQTLRIYAETDGETSTWELDFGGQALTLTLSPENHRGFSGEGQVLADLATRLDGEVLARTQSSLQWQSSLKPESFAGEWELAPEQVRAALGALGSRGLVGFDVQQGGYFHRVLPFDLSSIDRMHPRLMDAKALVAENKVRLLTGSDDPRVIAEVPGTGVTHRVQEFNDDAWRCTCQWFTKYQGKRGLCKHILATQIAARRLSEV